MISVYLLLDLLNMRKSDGKQGNYNKMLGEWCFFWKKVWWFHG